MRFSHLANVCLRQASGMSNGQLLFRHRVEVSFDVAKRWNHDEKVNSDTKIEKVEKDVKVEKVEGNKPVKFTTSEAHVNYIASRNFYGDDDRDLPRSHNLMLSATGIFAIYYLIFFRDDIEADGGQALLKPLHETVPQYAIPMLQSAIVENRKLGYSTAKLEKKLKEYMDEPEKYGGHTRKLVEN